MPQFNDVAILIQLMVLAIFIVFWFLKLLMNIRSFVYEPLLLSHQHFSNYSLFYNYSLIPLNKNRLSIRSIL